MDDRATLEKIFDIMRRLLLVRMDGLNPIPRKGTTRHECYRALYEIQDLLETRRAFGIHLPQTNADRIRAMTNEELAEFITGADYGFGERPGMCDVCDTVTVQHCEECWLDWLKQEAKSDG